MSRIVYLMGAGASRGRRKTDNAQYKMEKDEEASRLKREAQELKESATNIFLTEIFA